MMKKKILVLTLLVLVVLGIGTVSAETVTGQLGATGGLLQTTPIVKYTSGASTYPFGGLGTAHIENTVGLRSVVIFDNGTYPISGWRLSFQNGTSTGNQTNVHYHLYNTAGPIIGNGSIGFSRSFIGTTPQPWGYVYAVFTDYNPGTATGATNIVPDNDAHDCWGMLYNPTMQYYGQLEGGDLGNVYWYGNPGPFAGDYYILRGSDMMVDYTATKPSGLSITGTAVKTSGAAQVFIIDPDTGNTLKSDYSVTPANLSFDVPAQRIRIAVLSSQATWYNSSILFDPTQGLTPTPTPTPGTGEPAPGYVRTIVNVRDRSGAMIHGPNIQIKDVDGNVWSNSTSDADGIHSIDTHPDHVVNIYADYTIFSNEFLPGSLLTQTAGGTYYLTLDPFESAAPEGNVSLYVEVKDEMGSFIPYANVQIFLPSGYSYSGSTANLGSKVFIVPNATQIRATGSAAGYLPATVIGNSGAGGSTTFTITLTRQVVTTQPTSTIPPGGVTPAITVDPNDPVLHGGDTSFQGQEMMRYLANNGMTLVQLCFMVTILALLGFKFGK